MKWNPRSKPKTVIAPKSNAPAKVIAPRGGAAAAAKTIAPKAIASKKTQSPTKAPQKPMRPKFTPDDDRRVYGIHAVEASLRFMPERAKKLFYIEKNERNEAILRLAHEAQIPVEQTHKTIFDINYGGDIVHQGVMLITQPYPYVDLDSALRHTKLAVVLDSIEDPRNLGRSARSAFALGAELLIIPSDRAAVVTASAEKAAVGTLSRLKVAQVTNLNQALGKIKKAGMWVVGAAGEAETALWDCDLKQACALVIGSEEAGLRKLIRQNCDELVRIPMKAEDMSLNAADALTLMLYEVQRQRRQ